jgi:hypothetical protein
MALETFQARAQRRNRQSAIIAKISIPGFADVYICDADRLFKPMRANHPVDPILDSVDGLGLGAGDKTSDITLRVLNKKVNLQAANPLSESVKFSDLVKEGLDRATIEVKEYVLNTREIAIDNFDSANLQPLFKGRIRAPFSYDDMYMTLGATSEEASADIDYPVERIGEELGQDPRKEHYVIPIVFGDARFHSLGQIVDSWQIDAVKSPSVCKARVLDHTRNLVVLSSRHIDHQALTMKIGHMPTGIVVAEDYDWYADPDYPDYKIVEITGSLACILGPWFYYFVKSYFMLRHDADPYKDTTHSWEDYKKDGTVLHLAPDETYAVASPILQPGRSPTAVASTADLAQPFMFHLWLFIELTMPEAARLEVGWYYLQRATGGRQVYDYYGVITPADLTGSGWFSRKARFADLKNPVIRDGLETGVSIANWAFFSSAAGLGVRLKRLDSNPGDILVKGIYSVPLTMVMRDSLRQTEDDDLSVSYAFAGCGLPDITPRKDHPICIVKSALEELYGVASSDIDFRGPSDMTGSENWRCGVVLSTPTKMPALINEIEEQFGLMFPKDPDGVYRARCLARYGGKPTWQRYNRALKWGVDFRTVPKVEPLGDEVVENVIIVDYAPDADGNFQRTAWVKGASSDDGYGGTSPQAELVSKNSITDYGERRREIKAAYVRDAQTAVGVRDTFLSRGARPPSRVRIEVEHIGVDFYVGQIHWFDHALLDPVLKFNGESWAGTYFQIEDISRQDDFYTVHLLQCPQVEVEKTTMIIRPHIMLGGS